MHVELVRLVIPLAVVDELDGTKYARREEFQQPARELVTLIDRYATASPPDGCAEVRKGVTVEVLPTSRVTFACQAMTRKSRSAVSSCIR